LSEWTLIIETPDGTTAGHGEDVIDLFLSSLEANRDVLGPGVGADPDRGSLSTTFQVEAENKDDAVLRGCLAYWRALGDAGLNVDADSRVEIYPTGDSLEIEDVAGDTYGARVVLERRDPG
jgi:hypothetical protein